ncbi:salicylate synthase [Sphaerisporangium album]|uniref:Salicylate synthase n=1 Tax=Sphaerisporangium album TaxID=509200 RepID=A0A367FE80_9ACTN|nr:salicylate synthase [Sphaerisporangium album]RCG28581.1 salicylate synthase [Sphaerisporangium album]
MSAPTLTGTTGDAHRRAGVTIDAAGRRGRTEWAEWARAVAPLRYSVVLDGPDDPARAAVLLAQAGLGEEHAVYEHAGVWYFAAGSAVSLTAGAAEITARAGGRTWTVAADGRPLDKVAEALAALRDTGASDRHVYGWAAFELAHLLHGDPDAAGGEPLLYVMAPCAEVALSRGKAELRAVDDVWTRRIAALLRDAATPGPGARTVIRADARAEAAADTGTEAAADVGAGAPAGGRAGAPVSARAGMPAGAPAGRDAGRLIAVDGSAYRRAVAHGIADIQAGLLDKAVLSRTVPLPEGTRVDFAASYLAGRRANTPARSFLLDLGGRRAAGFSPETVVEVDASGRVSTQPLAGTRALGPDPAENARLCEELLADPKEVHEHAISVRLACEEMEAVCRPGSVVIEEFMAVRARGSVQHLASRVAGRLRDGLGPWSAFAALFPAVTATGVPKAAALAALSRHEPGPRGLYGGAVFRAGTDGSLDAALVLRTLFGHEGRTWLRAGAGVMGQSTPEREYEETCEKLRSVLPHLRFHGE